MRIPVRSVAPPYRSSVFAAVAMLAATACVDAPPGSLEADELVIDAAEIHVVGTLDTIARIEDLIPASDGGAWVVNSVEPFVVLLSPDGRELRAMGRSGDGPGEFSWPTTIVRNYDPTLATDLSRGRAPAIPGAGDVPTDAVADDRLWGVHTGEFDVEHVAWTRLPAF